MGSNSRADRRVWVRVDQNAPLRGASAVNDELEVGFDEKFEIDWSRLERVGRVAMSLLVVAGLAGVLGGGPLDHARAGRPGSGAVDYQPVARWSTATQLTLHLPPSATDATMVVTLSNGFVEPFGLQGIDPRPLSERSDRGNLQLTMAVRGGGVDNLVRVHGKPAQIGPIALRVRMGATPLSFSTFVLP